MLKVPLGEKNLLPQTKLVLMRMTIMMENPLCYCCCQLSVLVEAAVKNTMSQSYRTNGNAPNSGSNAIISNKYHLKYELFNLKTKFATKIYPLLFAEIQNSINFPVYISILLQLNRSGTPSNV